MKATLSIWRKEVNSYFSSPLALIFVGAFLAVSLFTFFYVDKFFTRNIADVRLLFRWMPTLLIFLSAALTMRQWSEEQQSGTLEILFTMPIKLLQMVLGKFLAVMTLVIVAIGLTLFLPITIASFGNLDSGPVVGGYLAAILMAGAYVAIGLFISSRTSNQIVALILTVAVCGIFQLASLRQVTDALSPDIVTFLRALGTGSRFESIERGVLDLRDLVYYLSLTAIFLGLNVLSLDVKRWGNGASTQGYRFNMQTGVALLTVNLLLFNAVLYPFTRARWDLTEGKEYSLSPATRDLLENLQEPLLIRGYFSEDNHPLLEPLIPQVEDMLQEYKIAGGDQVTVETLDPITDEEKEAEANQTYGIRPQQLQTSDTYSSSVINVYFDILIRYGDQSATLNFGELIEVLPVGDTDLEVRLRNLEYDLTSNIKRLVLGFQSVDAVLASLESPAQLTLYYTPATLPTDLAEAPATVQQVADEITAIANGQFSYQAVDVDDPSNNVDKEALAGEYDIQPFALDFFGTETFYFAMLLTSGDKSVVIYPPDDISEGTMREAIESALLRTSSGFLKQVGLWTPSQTPQQDMFGQQTQPLQTYQQVQQFLGDEYEVQTLDLTTGQVPSNLDILVVIQPENMTDLERYAIDQYLMRGGTVLVAGGNYKLAQDQMQGILTLQPLQAGLSEMLTHYGVTVGQEVVMDTQNDPFPTAVNRNVGGVTVQEVAAIDYPYFVDVREDGMDKDNPILSDLPAISLQWVSPLTVDATKTEGETVTALLESSDESWLTNSTMLDPNLTLYPETGFPIEGEQKPQLLGVVIEGTFESFFKGKPSPFDQAAQAPIDPTNPQVPAAPTQPAGLLEESSPEARLVVVGSNEFLNDQILSLSAQFGGDAYRNNLQFVQNTVDWATEDTDLLGIRARGASARLLDPLDRDEKRFWELLNYGLALASVVALGVVWQVRRRSEAPMPLVTTTTGGNENE